MSFRSNQNRQVCRDLLGSPKSQRQFGQHVRPPAHMLATALTVKPNGKNPPFQQQYSSLKDKIRSVEHKNAVILRKIKDNMAPVYQSEEDTFYGNCGEQSIKPIIPSSLQRTQVYSDWNGMDSLSQSQGSQNPSLFHFGDHEESYFVPVLLNSRKVCQCFGANMHQRIEEKIEGFEGKMRSQFGIILHEIDDNQNKFDMLSKVLVGLSGKIRTSKQLSQLKNRQRDSMIEDYREKLKQLSEKIMESERQSASYQNLLRDKNQTIEYHEETIRNLNNQYKSMKGESDLQKMKLSQKVIEISNSKSNEIQLLERKVVDLKHSYSLQFKFNDIRQTQKEISLKSELEAKNKEIEDVHCQIKKLIKENTALQSITDGKNTQLSKISFQLMETQMMSKKVKEMFEELQRDYSQLQTEKDRKTSEDFERVKILKEGQKKAIKEIKESVAQIFQFLSDLNAKIPRKVRKSFEDFKDTAHSNIEQVVKGIGLAFEYYQKRETTFNQCLISYLNVPSIELEVSKFQEIFERIKASIQMKNAKILELEETGREKTLKSIKILREFSPFSSTKKSQMLSPKNQSSFGAFELKEKKRQNAKLIEEISRKNNENQNYAKKIELFSEEVKEIKERNRNIISELKELKEQNMRISLQKQLKESEFREQLNKAIHTKISLEKQASEEIKKNRKLIKQIQSLNKKLIAIEVSNVMHLTKIGKMKEQKQLQENESKAKTQQKRDSMREILDERNELKAKLRIAKEKLDIQHIGEKLPEIDNRNEEIQTGNQKQVIESLLRTIKEKEDFIKGMETKNGLINRRKSEVEQDLRQSLCINKVFSTKKNIEGDEFKKEIQKIKQTNQQENNKHSTLVKKLSENLVEMQQNIKEKNSEITLLNRNLSESRKKQRGQISELTKTQDYIKILKQELADASRVNSQIIKINNEKEKELKDEKYSYEGEIASLQREISRLKKLIGENEGCCRQLRADVETLSSSVVLAQRLYEEYKGKVGKCLHEKQRLLNDQDSLEKERLSSINRLQIENLQLKSELKKINHQKEMMAKQEKEQSEQLKKLECILQAKQREIFKMIGERNYLKQSLMDDLDNKSEFIKGIRMEHGYEQQLLKENLEISQKQLCSCRKVIQDLSQKYERQMQQNDSVFTNIKATEKELQETKSQLQIVLRNLVIIRDEKSKESTQLIVENSKLKKGNDQFQRQLKLIQENKEQFASEMQQEHERSIKILENRIKKQATSFKNLQEYLLEFEKQCNKKETQCELLQDIVRTQKKCKQQLENQLRAKNDLYNNLKDRLDRQVTESKLRSIDGSIANTLSRKYDSAEGSHVQREFPSKNRLMSILDIASRTTDTIIHSGSVLKNSREVDSELPLMVNAEYIQSVKEEVMQIITGERNEFSQKFISKHNAQTAYQLSLFKSEVVRKNLRHSILEELQFADHYGIDFVSRFQDEIGDVVIGLEGDNQNQSGQVERYRDQMRNFQERAKNLEAEIIKLRGLKEQEEKMRELYFRDCKNQKKRADSLTKAISQLEGEFVSVLEVVLGAEGTTLELKEAFQNIDDIYEEVKGGSRINFNKYKEAYQSKPKEVERSRSKGKGWFGRF